MVERVTQAAAGMHGMAQAGNVPGYGVGPFRGIFNDEDAHVCTGRFRPRTTCVGASRAQGCALKSILPGF
ncbi:hypothetical protein CNMCM8686_001812 [Aspergillus fumigatus]|nr:hypothetical protein CNMCM8686_001812 [Aspergillus fumigatus]